MGCVCFCATVWMFLSKSEDNVTTIRSLELKNIRWDGSWCFLTSQDAKDEVMRSMGLIKESWGGLGGPHSLTAKRPIPLRTWTAQAQHALPHSVYPCNVVITGEGGVYGEIPHTANSKRRCWYAQPPQPAPFTIFLRTKLSAHAQRRERLANKCRSNGKNAPAKMTLRQACS